VVSVIRTLRSVSGKALEAEDLLSPAGLFSAAKLMATKKPKLANPIRKQAMAPERIFRSCTAPTDYQRTHPIPGSRC
jgi:hypothetical protein